MSAHPHDVPPTTAPGESEAAPRKPEAEQVEALARLATALRAAGVTAGIDRTAIAAEALAVLGEAGGAEPYWALRAAFCTRVADIPLFDAVYWGLFGPSRDSDEIDVVDVVSSVVRPEQPDASGPLEEATKGAGAGDAAELAQRDIAMLTEEQLEEIRTWIELLAPVPGPRKAMRCRPARTGRVDTTRTLRLLLRHHGELSAIRRRQRIRRPRRLLLMVDISGSMAPYSDALLRFAHAAVAARPRTTEVVVIGAGWTRLTDELRAGDPREALRAATAIKAHWQGGTRLGAVFQDFLRAWGGRNAVRGAVVVLCSDGFEFGDQTLLRQQVARLSRLADELVWLDPQRRTADFVPPKRDVAEAQSFATVRLAGHSFEALRELTKVIGR